MNIRGEMEEFVKITLWIAFIVLVLGGLYFLIKSFGILGNPPKIVSIFR